MPMTEHGESECYMVKNEGNQVRRGDIFYADFGTVEDAVGHEFAKRRPVLIIQNDTGNKNSGTTIVLCLSSKCKSGQPYRMRYGDLSVVKQPSDICAEQIKTIDKCRLEEYLGNVGPSVMKKVERIIAVSLGMKEAEADADDDSVIEYAPYMENEAEHSIKEQLSFWQNLSFRITMLASEQRKLDEEIDAILCFIEETAFNAAQGYKVYKVLRDKTNERRKIMSELTYLRGLSEQVQADKMIDVLSRTLAKSNEAIHQKRKMRLVEELMGSELQMGY